MKRLLGDIAFNVSIALILIAVFILGPVVLWHFVLTHFYGFTLGAIAVFSLMVVANIVIEEVQEWRVRSRQ